MAVQLNDFPSELLCKILNFLNTKEKFSARRVCTRWRDQIDKNVIFHIVLNDSNYDWIRLNFETSRCVRSIWIFDYSHEEIPIQNLTLLNTLTVTSKVNELAVSELLTKAKNLDHLQLYVDHERETATINQMARKTNTCTFPALLNIKNLHIGYDSRSLRLGLDSWSERAWNEILNEEMPNVHRLVVDLYPNIPTLKGFDYFRLAAGMPKLQDFTYRVWSSHRKNYYEVLGAVQPLTPTISKKLVNLNLTRLTAIITQKDEPIWMSILSRQRQIQKLILYNKYNSREGFPISMIYPVLHNNRESLSSISLQIDTKKSGDIDMEMFSSLPSLQKLSIQAWPTPSSQREYFDLSIIRNCSSVVTETLEKLTVKGFRFSEDDIINFIKNISKEDLHTVRICPGYAFVWRKFETREKEIEMGIVRCGHNSVHAFHYLSQSPNSSAVYVGATLEKFNDDEFDRNPKSDFSRRVKDVTVEPQSLQMVSRYIFSHK
ncbi:unnamed protein product [Orchesella dallaii]|uniref:F-box domain-containing protein n=1 Tax=Orchesella dallaii TaxID=48710 RepID=A0ABP1QLV5_9HEXA